MEGVLMQSIYANSYNYSDFNFSMTTSSGDTIDLMMYDETSSELSYQKDAVATTTMLSLKHSYGYEYKYEGDGIDAQDQKEIDAAMKQIEPMIADFMEKAQENSLSNAQITNKAFDINSYLAKPEDLSTKNYQNGKLLKTIDKILEKAENQNEKILKEAQKLFDALLKQQEQFELYM
jgi:hypothetical protein